MKNAFAVLLQKPDDRTPVRLTEKYEHDNVYRINDMTFLVRTKKQLADDVAVVAGIKGDERFVSGVVFKLNQAYAGYSARSLWEWLQEGEE